MPDFGDYERELCRVFSCGKQFNYRGARYVVKFAGKPTCSFGEPKTDVFVRCMKLDDGTKKDFKISYKKKNADFLENKISAERAEEILGQNWSLIISNATKSIKSEFEHRRLVFKSPFGRTDKGAITLGWKFEFVNRLSGDLSGLVPLSDVQKCEVFAGRNLPVDKRNACVCGNVIVDSGVADNMIVADDFDSVQDAADTMVPIVEYARTENIYFACKALNFRTLHNPPKWDGDRPLAVQVDWSVNAGRLISVLDFDHPLTRKGNEVGMRLKNAMHNIGVRDTDQLTTANCAVRL